MNLNGTVGLCVAPRPAPNRAGTTGCHFYAREILAHAGLWTTEVARESLAAALEEPDGFGVLLLAGDLDLSAAEVEALQKWVEAGGALLGVGATSGADALWGVEPEKPPSGFAVGRPTLGQGYVEVADAKSPIVSGLRSSLHYFNGVAVRAAQAVAVARVLDAHRRPTGRAAVTIRHLGRGLAILIAPDLPGSVALIQQGRYVDQDGAPAPDGTAPVSDNLLKADDGLMLDWDLDRDTAPGVPYPFFLHPVADELREILLRAVFFAARTVGATLPLLWYYPRNLPALAHLSHDSDLNDPELAMAMLEIVRELGLRDSWCIQMPGYPRPFYDALRATGQEIALHFDALEQGILSEWREENLSAQHEWLRHASGSSRVVTNKNHYTRWEGRLEFFRWCAAHGLTNDQTRGPSKIGETGFPFGTAHPHFPMDGGGALIDCLEIGFQSQDFVVFGPPEIIPHLAESAARVYGVAHVIFHPAHIKEPGVEEALRSYVRECRARGMEFWTSGEIDAWERARRRTRLERAEDGWRVLSDTPMPGATVLLLGEDLPGESVRRYGFEFHAAIGDIAPDDPFVLNIS
jgi:hypothetical protein